MIAYPDRPLILDRIPRDRPAVIEASAGTGKTFTLEHLVVELLWRENIALGEILVLTFTERAATELRKRIRTKIGQVLAAAPDEEGTRGARERLDRALYAFDAASIGTIHGFFGRILGEHAFHNGRLFEGTLEDGRSLFARAFKEALRRELAQRPGHRAELLELWLDRSKEGVEALENLLFRCHASRREIRPEFSLEGLRREVDSTPLFTMDLEGETERFGAALKAAGTHGNTVNSIKKRLAVLSAGFQRSGRDWHAVFDNQIQEAVCFIAERVRDRALGNGQAQTLSDAIVRLRDHVVTIGAAAVQESLPIVRGVLERTKNATGAFDYDDIIAGVAGALDGPGGAELVRSLRGRYRYALIDEFQDTDELQWQFFRRVFAESGGRNPVYVIGDPKQAIYSFRGADILTYLAARRELGAETAPVALAENFRSTPAMIAAYNRILDQGSGAPFFDGPIRYDTPVRSGRERQAEEEDGSPYVPVHLFPIEAPSVGLGLSELRRQLARRIAQEARTLLTAGRGLRLDEKGNAEAVKAGDIFVLTATNQDALRVAAALREERVPYAFYKQEGLFQSPEAVAVRDLLAAIDDPASPAKRERAWISPFFAVPIGALPDLHDVPDSNPLLSRLVAWNELAASRRFERLFARVLDDSGVVLRELFLKDEERTLTNILHLFEILLEEARGSGCTLADLVAALNGYLAGTRQPPGQDGNVQRIESDRAAVQIMSIHKSKGLEAAVVFLFGGFTAFPSSGLFEYHDEDGRRLLSIGDAAGAKEAADEERDQELQRLYYVALTRAKARLYLPLIPREHWSKRWDGGYRRVNERLLAIAEAPANADDPLLFRVVSASDEATRLRQGVFAGWTPDGEAPKGEKKLTSWRPQAKLLEDVDDSKRFYQLKAKHGGYEVASYSGMKQDWEAALDPLAPDVFRRESGGAAAVILAEGALPGGPAAGTLLHEILEDIPFATFSEGVSLDAWGKLEAVDGLVKRVFARNTIADEHRDEAKAIVYHALTTSIALGSGGTIEGLHRGTRVLREMEFLFPYPEASHPALGSTGRGKLVVDRGFIKGYVDLVFEHEKRVYFADWKSDLLPQYGPMEIEEHVRLHYSLQAKLYAIALVKALRVRSEGEYEARFGGLVYVFLRGLREAAQEGAGRFFERPAWGDILRFEEEVKQFQAKSGRGRR